MHTLSLEAILRTSVIRAGELTASEQMTLLGMLKREFRKRGGEIDADTLRVKRSAYWKAGEYFNLVHGMARGSRA